MFELAKTPLDGVALVKPPGGRDLRGTFFKVLHVPAFKASEMHVDFKEMYYSTSRRNVIRGMHFQTPPYGHTKLVWCMDGTVTDVVLDLRQGSATYGQTAAFELGGDHPLGVYIPEGFAHGFVTRSETAMMLYMVTSVHEPLADAGVLWDSFGFDWCTGDPVLSIRDKSFPTLESFKSPF